MIMGNNCKVFLWGSLDEKGEVVNSYFKKYIEVLVKDVGIEVVC